MSQNQFAEVTGVSPVTISRIERGVTRRTRNVDLYVIAHSNNPKELAMKLLQEAIDDIDS